MSLFSLVLIVGVLGAITLLLLVYSLLCQAQKGDAYLEKMGLGEGSCLDNWLNRRDN